MAELNFGDGNKKVTFEQIGETQNVENEMLESDVTNERGLTEKELIDPNQVQTFITDPDTPLLIFFGPPSCGKTMSMIRLSRYLKKQGYTIMPNRNFRPAYDKNYTQMCDEFNSVVNSDMAAPGNDRMAFMLLTVYKGGKPVCQIVEAPGEHYFDPNPKASKHFKNTFPKYIFGLITASNRKVWAIMLEPNWLLPSIRNNYVDKMRVLKNNMRSNDRVIFVHNKIDELSHLLLGTGRVNEKEARNVAQNEYPGVFNLFLNDNPITRLVRPYNCSYLPFMTGYYTTDMDGAAYFTEGPDEFPRRFWQQVLKYI